MSVIPISSIVDVNITVSPQFPARGNFSILNIITSEVGVIDAVERIRYYANIDEVSVDWTGGTQVLEAANTYFSQSPTPNLLAVSFRDDLGGETITESLDAIQNVNPNWYGFIFTNEVRDLIVVNGGAGPAVLEAADWAQARVKIFGNIANAPDVLNPAVATDIVSLLQLGLYSRTFTDFSSTTTEYPAASGFGRAFTVNFNQENSTITLKFKQFPGITPEEFTSSQKLALDNKRGNAYFQVGNAADTVSMYGESFMAENLFFDEVHNIDWLANAIENQVFGYLFTRATKVPLTDKGGAQLEQQVIKVLDEAVNNGMIAPGVSSEGVFLPNGYITAVQKVADIPDALKEARVGPNITFIALLAGAVHSIEINGVVER